MRKKDKAKYNQIVEIAKKLFIAKGFDATSMSEISRELGGSKATLYSYFPSKEALINLVMFESVQEMSTPIFNILDDENKSLKTILYEFGVSYLKFMFSSEMIDIRKTILTSLHQIENGPKIFKNGPLKKWKKISALFQRNMDAKILKRGDAWRAAVQYISLIECEHINFLILGVKTRISKNEIEVTVKSAVDIFLSYYMIKK